jgi:uncharacterized protein
LVQRYLSFPFRLAPDGRVANSKIDSHVKELIIQLLFTNPGERVNLPEFGCGLMNIVFEGNTEGLASQVKFMITQALNRWLGDIITVEDIVTESKEGELRIEVIYTRKDTLVQDSVSISV